MSKLSNVTRVPRQYDPAPIQEVVRQHEQQINQLAEGKIAGRHDARAAAPTAGNWQIGDIIWHSAPTSGGFIGFVCTASGTPGTWKTWGAIS